MSSPEPERGVPRTLDYAPAPSERFAPRSLRGSLRAALLLSGLFQLAILGAIRLWSESHMQWRISLIVLVFYWLLAARIILSRSKRLTRGDLLYIKYGYPLLSLPLMLLTRNSL